MPQKCPRAATNKAGREIEGARAGMQAGSGSWLSRGRAETKNAKAGYKGRAGRQGWRAVLPLWGWRGRGGYAGRGRRPLMGGGRKRPLVAWGARADGTLRAGRDAGPGRHGSWRGHAGGSARPRALWVAGGPRKAARVVGGGGGSEGRACLVGWRGLKRPRAQRCAIVPKSAQAAF